MTLQVKNEAAIVGPISLCRVFFMYLVTRHVLPTPKKSKKKKKKKKIRKNEPRTEDENQKYC